MKNVMSRAWEIYRTLKGDHIAKLKMAMQKAWNEVKKAKFHLENKTELNPKRLAVLLERINTGKLIMR